MSPFAGQGFNSFIVERKFYAMEWVNRRVLGELKQQKPTKQMLRPARAAEPASRTARPAKLSATTARQHKKLYRLDFQSQQPHGRR
jgi:hypothetical protein